MLERGFTHFTLNVNVNAIVVRIVFVVDSNAVLFNHVRINNWQQAHVDNSHGYERERSTHPVLIAHGCAIAHESRRSIHQLPMAAIRGILNYFFFFFSFSRSYGLRFCFSDGQAYACERSFQ